MEDPVLAVKYDFIRHLIDKGADLIDEVLVSTRYNAGPLFIKQDKVSFVVY